jgi:hypothetical protein
MRRCCADKSHRTIARYARFADHLHLAKCKLLRLAIQRLTPHHRVGAQIAGQQQVAAIGQPGVAREVARQRSGYVAILTFLPAWNQYLWPLMSVQTEQLRPVMVGLDYFKQLNTSWGQIMAYASLITIPVLALFIAFQRSFINSIASSGVKG